MNSVTLGHLRDPPAPAGLGRRRLGRADHPELSPGRSVRGARDHEDLRPSRSTGSSPANSCTTACATPAAWGTCTSSPAPTTAAVRSSASSSAHPDGHAVLRADATDLAAFLADTFLAVPLGEESADLDLEAVLLLLLTES